MAHGDELRRRNMPQNQPNGDVKHAVERTYDPEFAVRESPLTILIGNSLHIRAIYHIFVVILIVLFCDTVIYDLVERGEINIGIQTIVHGFGDIGRAIRLWLFDMSVVLSFYPLLRIYATGAGILKNSKVFRRVWMMLGVVGVVALQVALVGVPVWSLAKEHLAIASSIAVTAEMFRLFMKIHTVTVACGPKCHDGTPLPTLKHYIYFLFAPTLIYRDEYPRTRKIRWGVVAFHLMEVAAIIFYNSFLWERLIMPYWSDYGKESKIEAGVVLRGIFGCVLPGVINFLSGFYMVLHAWLNAAAEMLTFADRLFYEEWWTSSQFSRYYRAWNRVVHSWLRDHIHRPLAPHAGRVFATLAVFVVSSIAHEVMLMLSMGFFYPVLLVEFGVCGLLMVPLTASSGRRFPNILNLLMWLAFFIGNGLLYSLYPMEYFARKNCPPSENDSFFIPKSWSCPEIVLKPNWTFQNPLSLIY